MKKQRPNKISILRSSIISENARFKQHFFKNKKKKRFIMFKKQMSCGIFLKKSFIFKLIPIFQIFPCIILFVALIIQWVCTGNNFFFFIFELILTNSFESFVLHCNSSNIFRFFLIVIQIRNRYFIHKYL